MWKPAALKKKKRLIKRVKPAVEGKKIMSKM